MPRQHETTEQPTHVMAPQQLTDREATGPQVPGQDNTAPHVPGQDDESTWRQRAWEGARDKGGTIAATVLTVAALGAAAYLASSGEGDPGSRADGSRDNGSQASGNGKCADTWERDELSANSLSRFQEQGLPAARTADTSQEARKAAGKWWKLVRGDTEVGAAMAERITGRDVKEAKLFDSEGCATDYAEQVSERVSTNLALSTITPGQVPSNYYNTGLNGGRMTQASAPGISGDRRGVNVTLPNGQKFSILARCAQPAFPGNPGLTPGPHDQPPTPGDTPRTRIPEGGPEEKIPAKHDDGKLPGNPKVPADQDKGTPDKPGQGPAGQTPNPAGYVPGETPPPAQPQNPTPPPLAEAQDTRDPAPAIPAQTGTVPEVTGPGTPAAGSDAPTPTTEVVIP